MLFNGYEALLRTLITGVPAYVALVILLRISGKRTLGKWNAFDFVVTVAFGSTLASALLSPTTSAMQTTVAFATLIALQYLVTRSATRFHAVERLVKARPALLLHRGEMLTAAMRAERVTEAEVLAALRGAGIGDLEDAAAVVLETDGSFSVLSADRMEGGSTLADVARAPLS